MISFKFKKDKGFKAYIKSLEYVKDNNIDNILEFYIKNNNKIINSNNKSILIKGEVQSGKTNNIIYLIDKLSEKADYIIYLSGSLNELNEQNKNRIQKSLFFLKYKYFNVNMNRNSFDENQIYKFKKESPNSKIFFFGIKNKDYLNNIYESIYNYDNKSKIIIFDDESDYFNISKEQIILKKKLINSNNVVRYISITATPYQNLYKNQELYNEFIVYESHDKYMGINNFLDKYKNIDGYNEKDILNAMVYKVSKNNEGIILWNVDKRKHIHSLEEKKIKRMLIELKQEKEKFSKQFKLSNLDKNNYFEALDIFSRNRFIINSNHKLDVIGKYAIFIGRNKMARGITYQNLICEYINMNPKFFNPSVIMQASRWFGTRDTNKMNIYMNYKLIQAYKECLILEHKTNSFLINDSYIELYNSLDFKFLIKKW